MHDDLSRRAHTIFKRAIDVDAGERTAFVEAACGGDESLRRRVLALVTALDETQGFLETPALEHPMNTWIHAAAAAHVGDEIGGYRVESVIGIGGMATVYRALQERPRRHVALKVMKRGLMGTSALRRFEFETEVLARLRHPGIAQIFESGAFDDGSGGSAPFFAMEYIENARPLTAYADQESLGVQDRLRMFAAVCDAVQHGHQRGVIHRDLKPANILVDSSGQFKVIDFGVARSTDLEQELITQHTDAGQLIGTLNYMSPEQCTLTSADLDVRCDVYSLGVILYELLCGRRPHDLSQVPVPEALRRIQQDAPPRPVTIEVGLRGDLEAIILKAIEKDPGRRYRSATELSNDIRRFLRHETIEARQPTAFYQIRLFTRRNRTLVSATAIIFVTLLISTIVSVRLAQKAREESTQRLAAETTAIEQRDAAQWQAYVATIAAAHAAHEAGEFHRMRTQLSMAPSDLRGWEWQFLNGLAQPSLDITLAHDDMIFGFDASPDLSRLATGCADGSVRIWDAATRSLIAACEGHTDRVMSLAFSPDGQRLVSGSYDRTVRIWDAATGEELDVLKDHQSEIHTVAIGRDNLIASASRSGAYTWDGNTGELIGELTDQPSGINGVAFSEDGEDLYTWGADGSLWVRGRDSTLQLTHDGVIGCVASNHDRTLFASGAEDGSIRVWRPGEDEPILTMQSSRGIVRSLAFTHDGQTLASGHTRRTIDLWSLQTGEIQAELSGHSEAVSGVRYSLDDAQLFSSSWDRTIRVWDMEAPDPVMTLRGHDDRVIAAAFSPDGSMIASAAVDGTVRLWDATLGTELCALRGHNAGVYAVAFSPDGKRLASASTDRTIKLWDLLRGAELATLPHEGSVWSVAFSPDGASLVSSGDDRTIRIWDTASATLIRTISGHESRVTNVTFSPDGSRIASASRDSSVRLWDVESGRELHVLTGHESDVFSVVFSADGKTLYSGSRDQTVRLWDVQTGRHLDTFSGHGQFVTSLSLSPDGSRLAAGSWFRDIVLWDLTTGDVVAAFKAHDLAIRSVAFDSRGRRIVSGSHDTTVRVWDTAPRQVRRDEGIAALASYEAAETIVDDLLATLGSQSLVAEAIETDTRLNKSLRPWARKVVLMRSLAGSANATRPPTD